MTERGGGRHRPARRSLAARSRSAGAVDAGYSCETLVVTGGRGEDAGVTGDEIDGTTEIGLAGGSLTPGVVRVGDTVRRPVGPWTPAVHALLRHLEGVGFDGAPRVLGFDEKGREILTYLPSDATPSWSDDALVATARLVRQLHEALADFVPPPGATWRLFPGVRHPPTGRVGHNDLCPANTVFANRRPYGFIDWDLAGPARDLHDLAYAAYSFVSLRPDRFWPRPGCPAPPDRPARLRLFCDGYGVDDRLGLLDAVEALLRDELADTVELGQRGVWPYEMMLARGEDRFRRWELAWLAEHRLTLEQALR